MLADDPDLHCIFIRLMSYVVTLLPVCYFSRLSVSERQLNSVLKHLFHFIRMCFSFPNKIHPSTCIGVGSPLSIRPSHFRLPLTIDTITLLIPLCMPFRFLCHLEPARFSWPVLNPISPLFPFKDI